MCYYNQCEQSRFIIDIRVIEIRVILERKTTSTSTEMLRLGLLVILTSVFECECVSWYNNKSWWYFWARSSFWRLCKWKLRFRSLIHRLWTKNLWKLSVTKSFSEIWPFLYKYYNIYPRIIHEQVTLRCSNVWTTDNLKHWTCKIK